MKRLCLSAALLLGGNLLCMHSSRIVSASIIDGKGRLSSIGEASLNSNHPDGQSDPTVLAGQSGVGNSGCSAGRGACELADAMATRLNVSDQVPAQEDNRTGPRYDVTRFGAMGNNATDDTVAIQAAFKECWNGGHYVAPRTGIGGVVEFPGAKNYIISSTIYTYDSCRIEGMVNGQTPSDIKWNGPAAGVVYSVASFTAATNSTPYYPAYSPPDPPLPPLPYTITFPVPNTVSVNDWVLVQGFSTPAGRSINNTVAQVVAASSSSFTVVVPFHPASEGTITDTGTVTTINVMFASDAHSRYYEDLRDIEFRNKNGIPMANTAGVDFYFGSRVDTGTKVWGAWAEDPLYYGFYFSQGGIDIDFDKGWRADDPGIAGIYWRVTGGDNFGIANGTVSTNKGAGVMLDNSACVQGSMVRFTARNMGMEVEDKGLAPGMGMFMLLDCPSDIFPVQFAIDMENTRTAGDRGSVNYSTIVMSPPNDLALNLNIVNGIFPNGSSNPTPNTTQRWVGIPSLTRYDASGPQGEIPSLVYAPSLTSSGDLGKNYNNGRAMSQCIGDCNIGQLWQYGVQASAFLYSDTAFSALPNATTLFAGQIIAPPSNWKDAKGSPYVIDVVYQTGTTGIPNRGATTCTKTNIQYQLVCTSANDLSIGQHINAGAVTNAMITRTDTTNPSAVLLTVNKNVGAISTAASLNFSAPVLGPEIQLPTKSQGAPNNGTCSGCSGKGMRTVQAFCAGIAKSSSTLTMFGAGSASTSCSSSGVPGSDAHLLMNTNGNLNDLSVRCAHTGVNSSSGVFSIWDLPSGRAMSGADSGTNTGITVTYGTTNADTALFDSTHTFSYSKGDLLRVQFTTQANETLGDCEASFNY